MRTSWLLAGIVVAVAAGALVAIFSKPGKTGPEAPQEARTKTTTAKAPAPAETPKKKVAPLVAQPESVAPPVGAPHQPGQDENTIGQEKQMDSRLQCRWFFSFGYGWKREDVDKAKSLIGTAAAHGLNGIVLSSSGLDSISLWSEEDVRSLKEIAALCKEKQIELIPSGLSVGYGGGALGHDPNFAAALPLLIDLTAKAGKCAPAAGGNLLKNGGLEEYKDGRFANYDFHDQPGQVTFVDAETKYEGKTSIRFENFTANQHGHGRIMQRAKVRTGYSYRFSCMIKTDGLQPVSGVQLLVLKEDVTVASTQPQLKPNQDWIEISLDFVNSAATELRLYAGIWGGKSGKFWLDDIKLYEYATLADIVRRDGTPLSLRSLDRDMTFVEGRDFEEVKNKRDLQYITLKPNTSIKEGEKLELSCYKTPFVGHPWGRQISLCMSNPALYEYWETEARRLYDILKYKKVLLSMDEIRNGGGCLLCRNRGVSMGEILGDCITRQHAIFEKIDPEIEVFVWSDMLDPNHNAHGNYYGVIGDFTGSWKHVPKDLVIACWYYDIRDKSLDFFSKEGFRTLGAAYYDADDLTNPREWLKSLKKTKDAVGIMYTSWEKKYDLLADFGDLVSETK